MFTTVMPLTPVASEVTGQVTPQVRPEVAPEVIGMLSVLKGAMDRRSLQVAMELKAEKNFRLVYLRPALDAGLTEMTIPDKPKSSKQRYRLSEAGKRVLGGG
jgi:ATP-dependent DNA helicase RecG